MRRALYRLGMWLCALAEMGLPEHTDLPCEACRVMGRVPYARQEGT